MRFWPFRKRKKVEPFTVAQLDYIRTYNVIAEYWLELDINTERGAPLPSFPSEPRFVAMPAPPRLGGDSRRWYDWLKTFAYLDYETFVER